VACEAGRARRGAAPSIRSAFLFLALAAGPHPRRELSLMPRLGAWPQALRFGVTSDFIDFVVSWFRGFVVS